MPLENPSRCAWCGSDPLYVAYHDQEWGVPLHDDFRLFELLTLEGAQAGLSWITVLRKREAYRQAFVGFDPAQVACYSPETVATLMLNPGIVRNRLKLESTVSNALAFLEVQRGFQSFDAYLWGFAGGQPKPDPRPAGAPVPAQTPLAEALSKDLKRRGFRFVGPTIMYAFLQAVGIVNDHVAPCWKAPL